MNDTRSGPDNGHAAYGGMDLEDPEWARLLGGYRVPYDPRNAFHRLERGDDLSAVWDEIWTELHHQGDLGEASYAAVPHLVRIHAARGIADWNTYALLAIIEGGRQNGRNPELPEKLRPAYEAAWQKLVSIGLDELRTAKDPRLVNSIIAVLAIGKAQPTLGRFAVEFTEDERKEIFRRAGWE